MTTLQHLPKLAATYIKHHGWTQGTDQNKQGQVCLTGALRLCAPIPGDGYLAREVFRRRQHAEKWNDHEGRTADEVIGYLESSEITDTELAEVFGPQWPEIVAQVRQISSVTPEQVENLGAAWDAAWGAAWGAALDAARDAARDAALDAALGAARDAARDAARGAALDAARGAALALSTRDLVGTGNYAQKHYEKLAAPWVSVFGALHPEDGVQK